MSKVAVFARQLALVGCMAGCNVTPLSTTGGAELPARGDCPRGLAVVTTDFQSSEIALLTPNGEVASPAFMSSASTRATGLAAPLSGDIVVAPSRARPGELVIVDRFGTNVITFVDTATATVRAQLPVGTGFEANAQTYFEVSARRGLVPRIGENAEPGREPYDAGSDLLIIDPSVPSIVGSLELPRKSGYLPAPVAVTWVGQDALVTLQHARADYSGMAEAELVAVDPASFSVRYRSPIPGLKNCGKLELSPGGGLLGIACEGYIDPRGEAIEPEASAIVVLDASVAPPVELRRFNALDLVGGPLQPSLEFLSDDVVLFKTQTALGGATSNRLFALDLSSSELTLVTTAASDDRGRGLGLALGDVICNEACSDPCLIADRSRGALLRVRPLADRPSPSSSIFIGGAGLPPTALSVVW